MPFYQLSNLKGSVKGGHIMIRISVDLLRRIHVFVIGTLILNRCDVQSLPYREQCSGIHKG